MLLRSDTLQSLRRLVGAMLLTLVSACVYRVDVQQGNLLEDNDVDAVQVGMTRSQVRFLLGTPVVEDTFHRDRWDYIYYFRQGRQRVVDRNWLIVYFDGDRVREIQKDVTPEPT
jgi:outer membrane protein assembly factor BamE